MKNNKLKYNKNIISEEYDPNEAIQDKMLKNMRTSYGLSGQNLNIYNLLKKWTNDIERSTEFIGNVNYIEDNGVIYATVQHMKGDKDYIAIKYNTNTKTFKIEYFHYIKDGDKLELIEGDETNSPSNIETLLNKYKNYIMNKRPLTEEKKQRQYSEEDIDMLKHKTISLIKQLRDACDSHLPDTKFSKQLKDMYTILSDSSSFKTLKNEMIKKSQAKKIEETRKLKNSIPVAESGNITVSAKADSSTMKKAKDFATAQAKDLKIVDESASLTVGTLRSIIKEAQNSKLKSIDQIPSNFEVGNELDVSRRMKNINQIPSNLKVGKELKNMDSVPSNFEVGNELGVSRRMKNIDQIPSNLKVGKELKNMDSVHSNLKVGNELDVSRRMKNINQIPSNLKVEEKSDFSNNIEIIQNVAEIKKYVQKFNDNPKNIDADIALEFHSTIDRSDVAILKGRDRAFGVTYIQPSDPEAGGIFRFLVQQNGKYETMSALSLKDKKYTIRDSEYEPQKTQKPLLEVIQNRKILNDYIKSYNDDSKKINDSNQIELKEVDLSDPNVKRIIGQESKYAIGIVFIEPSLKENIKKGFHFLINQNGEFEMILPRELVKIIEGKSYAIDFLSHLKPNNEMNESIKKKLNNNRVKIRESQEQTYFETNAGALNYVREKLKGEGLYISEFDEKIIRGTAKPSEGKTNRFDCSLVKIEDDEEIKTNKFVHIQIYNRETKEKPYELNYYKSTAKKK